MNRRPSLISEKESIIERKERVDADGNANSEARQPRSLLNYAGTDPPAKDLDTAALDEEEEEFEEFKEFEDDHSLIQIRRIMNIAPMTQVNKATKAAEEVCVSIF